MMTTAIRPVLLILAILGLCLTAQADDPAEAPAKVSGRYVVYGNGLSQIMGVAEFEVWSWGENVVADRPDQFTVNCLLAMKPESLKAHLRNLVDGNKDTLQRWPHTFEVTARGMGYKDAALSHCAFEVDLGAEMVIDRIELYRSRYIQDDKQFVLFGDLGWRYVLVLDEDRKIVAWQAFNIYPPDWKLRRGHWTIVPTPAEGAPAGRHVPAGSLSWLSEAEYIRDFLGKPVQDMVAEPTAADLARQAAFARRDTPEEIDRLGRDFFRVVDLDRPGLAAVKALVEEERYAEALEAFKAPFFETISVLDDLHGGFEYSWMSDANSRSGMRARDLENLLYADKETLTVKRFVPGLLPPAKFEYPFQMRPLLLAYAATGEERYLRSWEAMTDDWAMGFQDAADRDPLALRDHFVLVCGPAKDNLYDLVNAAKDRPEFVEQLSGATLARYLLPILEEVPVSIWRVTRTATFNHTYNAIPGGWTLSQALADFRAGQRLEREMELGFIRLYTDGLYRDGSMVEVGDEGHYAATVHSPGNLYALWAAHGRPAWLNRGLETYFLDYYRANILSHVRNVAPSGVGARWSASVDRLGVLRDELNIREAYELERMGDMGQDAFHGLTKPPLMEPEPRAIIETVYGRGRPTFEDKAKAQDQLRLAEVYAAPYVGEPRLRSDWMPYTGLWYFRSGWDSDASYLHMVKPGSPNNMGGAMLYPITRRYGDWQFPPTSYRFHDFATPLMTGHSVEIDGLPPCPREGRFPSGSKQGVFTRARETPQAARWYTDDSLDFGEAIYQGSYRMLRMDFDHTARESRLYQSPERVADVTTWRQIMQVLPARLFLQVDRVRYSDGATHRQTLPNTMILVQPNATQDPTDDQLYVLPEQRRVITDNPGNGSITVAYFGQRALELALSQETMEHGSFRPTTTITHSGYRHTMGRQVLASWEDAGETVLISVLRAELAPEQAVVAQATISDTTGLAAAAEPDALGLDDLALDEPEPDAAPVEVLPERSAIRAMRDLSDATIAGVEVTMQDGTTATLLVARRPPAALTVGAISVGAEALLVVALPEQAPTGLVLGAVADTPDYRFELAEALTTTPIHRPIDPPTIGPAVNTFTDRTTVTISSETPDVTIYYIAEALDYPDAEAPVSGMARATDHAEGWVRYTGPFEIDADTFVRARAIRNGVEEIPFTAAGTEVSAVSHGFFRRRDLQPAVAPEAELQPGLTYDYLEGRWFALWTYADVLPAVATGTVESLLDVSMRATDGPFGVRYSGYIDVPDSGVYTFYAPTEFFDKTCEPGYDLRVYVDGQEWALGGTWHGRGQWSVPLAKGPHRFLVTYADARAKDLESQRVDLWRHYPYPETTWRGTAPVLEVAGPALDRQALPTSWLKH